MRGLVRGPEDGVPELLELPGEVGEAEEAAVGVGELVLEVVGLAVAVGVELRTGLTEEVGVLS